MMRNLKGEDDSRKMTCHCKNSAVIGSCKSHGDLFEDLENFMEIDRIAEELLSGKKMQIKTH